LPLLNLEYLRFFSLILLIINNDLAIVRQRLEMQSKMKGEKSVAFKIFSLQDGLKFAKTQPKLTNLDSPCWLAPMPLYVSQLRARLNIGSVSIRLHRHDSCCIPNELSPPRSVLYLLRADS
jgi:hypothetical protein